MARKRTMYATCMLHANIKKPVNNKLKFKKMKG